MPPNDRGADWLADERHLVAKFERLVARTPTLEERDRFVERTTCRSWVSRRGTAEEWPRFHEDLSSDRRLSAQRR